jgi:hypothetical protein
MIIDSRLVVTDIALAFIRPKHGAELKNILGSTIGAILKLQDLDLCIDPVEVSHVLTADRVTRLTLYYRRFTIGSSMMRRASPVLSVKNHAMLMPDMQSCGIPNLVKRSSNVSSMVV